MSRFNIEVAVESLQHRRFQYEVAAEVVKRFKALEDENLKLRAELDALTAATGATISAP